MRDLHFVEGKKQLVASIEDALKLVREKYPTAYKQGAVGAWTFLVGKEIIAEAWLKGGRTFGWWLRIKASE